ncbi:hypothetical protein ACJMK2_013796 [Sinanodonta woodiana]|uniref:COR domain-containing protein n=1 Tax=Sinanodonta woodiana TaxID=1069815 RepID=A0ABD3UZW7_SINWO
MPAKRVKSETQTRKSDTEDFTLPTTSTHADTATNEESRPSNLPGTLPVSVDNHPNTQGIMKKRKMDAEQEQTYRQDVCENYFREIRLYLKDKPTRFHLIDEDFAIDNTVVDSKLVDLRKKILEVASHQPYWGEEVPARWILLERELMKLRDSGIKVIPRTLLEAFNREKDVQIPTEELDLFLKFQNDIGTILYFSIEVLKDKIVLVPQWMIDAVKSLITAEMFVLRKAPAVTEKWDMFNKSGKLFPELIECSSAGVHVDKQWPVGNAVRLLLRKIARTALFASLQFSCD